MEEARSPLPLGGRGVAGNHHVTALETLDAGGSVSSDQPPNGGIATVNVVNGQASGGAVYFGIGSNPNVFYNASNPLKIPLISSPV